METETDKQLPFLDVFVSNVHSNLTRSVFHKSIYRRLLLDFTSCTSYVYEIASIKYLIERVYKINNTWIKINDDLINIRNTLKCNSYPRHIVNKVIEKYIEEKISKGNSQIMKEKDM